MSTKDLIERLNRQAKGRGAGAATPTKKSTSGETQTRVGARVIRRRKKTDKAPSAAELRGRLPGGAQGGDATEGEAPAARRVVRRTPAKAEAPAPAPAPAAEAAPATGVRRRKAPTPEEASQPLVAPVAEPAPAAEAAPAPAPEAPVAEPAPAAEAPVVQAEAAPSAEAASSAESAPAAEAASAAEAAPAAKAAPAAEAAPVVDAAPAAEPASAAEAEAPAAEAAPATEAGADAEGGDEAGPTQARTIARALPRADGSRPNQANRAGKQPMPGLGAGVIAPPPGYDPSNPQAFHDRLKEQRQEEEARQAREKAAAAKRPPQWRDQTTGTPGMAGPGTGTDADRNRRGRGGVGATKRRRRRRDSGIDFMSDGGHGIQRRRRNKRRSGPKKASPKAAAHKRRVEVPGEISVGNLAHGMSVKANDLIRKLIAMGQMVTINDVLDFETATLVAEEFEYEVVNSAFQEDEHLIEVEDSDEDKSPRPPVVTIMGHVDHGKTSLLDTIRKADVASGEAGGITQHISAYQVRRNGDPITFIDTPGHAAFTGMRARGAKVTDIVILVVAADDGVMPQTIEVINHAKAADVEIIVAVNKVDKPEAQVDRVKTQVMEYGLVPEDYGGETMFVETSAHTGQGIDDLLDAILLINEMNEYGANAERHGEGTVLEARLERGKGVVATVLVQHGTLKQGDRIVAGTEWGRVRAVSDYNGKRVKTAGPSSPVEIMGLGGVPSAGDNLVVVKNDKDAKTLAEHRAEEARLAALTGPRSVSLEDLLARAQEGEKVTLNLIVKADVGGSLEALKGSIDKIDVPGTDIRILHSAVGGVTESDVTLAHTNDAVIMGFNVRPDNKARKAAISCGIEVRTYRVIYEALEDIEKALKGLLAPETKEEVMGTAEVRQTFSVPKVGTIAGCMVTDGKVGRAFEVRLLREGTIIWTGRLGSLRRFKDDVREVANGYECGMNLDGFNDLKIGDVIEAFTMVEVERD